MIDFKHIWNRMPYIYFFNSIKEWIVSSKKILVYSCFNFNGDVSICDDTLQNKKSNCSNKILKVYYTGERFLDDYHSDVTIGFLPNNYSFKDLNKKFNNVITNLNYQYDNDINNIEIDILKINIGLFYNYNFNELSKYNLSNKDKLYIQLRDQERTEIEYLIKEQIRIEKLNLFTAIKFNQKYLEGLELYDDINNRWKNIYSRMKNNLFKINQMKPYFCCFIVSNSNCVERNMFFELLKKYKFVDSSGGYLNNVSYNIPDREEQVDEYINYISKFKFMITFENHSLEFYHTEKIYNALKAGTVPIYWGDPLITDVYNDESFININSRNKETGEKFTLVEQFKEFEDIIKKIIEIDTNLEKYLSFFKNGCIINPKKEDIRLRNNLKIIENLHNLI